MDPTDTDIFDALHYDSNLEYTEVCVAEINSDIGSIDDPKILVKKLLKIIATSPSFYLISSIIICIISCEKIPLMRIF